MTVPLAQQERKAKFVVPESDDDELDREGEPLLGGDAPSFSSRCRVQMYEAWDWAIHPNGEPLLPEIWRSLKPGFTVALVNIPLSIALALASGSDPNAGILTAFWAGLVAAIFGGTRFNIVGPTGALSAVLLRQASEHGKDILPLLAIMTSVCTMLVWVFHLDRYVMFIPSSVIHGFTLGVAVIIGFGQLNNALGLHHLPPHESFVGRIMESLKHIGDCNPNAAIWFVCNFGLLMFLATKFGKVPWAIVFATIGIIVGYLCEQNKLGDFKLGTLGDDYGDLTLQIIRVPNITASMFTFDAFTASLTITFIGVLETLISARIADGMTKTTHDQRREVFGLALANAVGGALGGIPATAALARTALNIKSGARTRVAAVVNCIAVLLLGIFVMPYFKYIPMATVAALLAMVAVRMVAMDHLLHMWHYDKVMLLVALLSAFFCIAIDTMVGILVGAVVSLLIFVDKMSVGHSEVHLHKGKKTLSHLDLTALDHHTPNALYKNQRASNSNLNLGASGSTSLGVPSGDIHPASSTNTLTGASSGNLATAANPPAEEEFGDVLVYRITGQLTYVNGLAHEHRLIQAAQDDHIMYIIISLRYLFYADLDGLDTLAQIVEKLETTNVKVLVSGVPSGLISNQLGHFDWFKQKRATGSVFHSYIQALDHLYGIEERNNQSDIAFRETETETETFTSTAIDVPNAQPSYLEARPQLAAERKKSIERLRRSISNTPGGSNFRNSVEAAQAEDTRAHAAGYGL